MSLTKIIHLSDLHIGAGDLAGVATHLVDKIIAEHDPEQHAVALTGDLVDEPTKPNFKRAAALLARLDGYRVMCVPGNHDVLPLRGVDLGLIGKGDYALWRRYISKGAYPQRWPLGGGWTALGIDTNEGSSTDATPDLARGEVGAAQLLRLTFELSRHNPVIVLGHHRLWWRDAAHLLKDADELHSILDPRCALYLCGHQHEHHDIKRGGVRYIAAPSSTKSRRFQVIDLDDLEAAPVWCAL